MNIVTLYKDPNGGYLYKDRKGELRDATSITKVGKANGLKFEVSPNPVSPEEFSAYQTRVAQMRSDYAKNMQDKFTRSEQKYAESRQALNEKAKQIAQEIDKAAKAREKKYAEHQQELREKAEQMSQEIENSRKAREKKLALYNAELHQRIQESLNKSGPEKGQYAKSQTSIKTTPSEQGDLFTKGTKEIQLIDISRDGSQAVRERSMSDNAFRAARKDVLETIHSNLSPEQLSRNYDAYSLAEEFAPSNIAAKLLSKDKKQGAIFSKNGCSFLYDTLTKKGAAYDALGNVVRITNKKQTAEVINLAGVMETRYVKKAAVGFFDNLGSSIKRLIKSHL